MKISFHTRLISSISQFINAVFLGGMQDESVSARAWREDWAIYKTIDRVFVWLGESNHCYNAHQSDIQRAEWLLDNKRR